MRAQREDQFTSDGEPLAQAQKRYTAQANAWVSSTAKRLHCEEAGIIHAIRTGLFPEQLDECGSGIAFLTLMAGRKTKSFIPSSKFVADDEKAHMKREQKRQQRAQAA